MASSTDPAGWIAFEAAEGLESQFWLETDNTTSGILNAGWDYPWDADGTDPPETKHFATLRSVGTSVARDYAGINSSGGPQVAGRADHDEIVVVKDADLLTPVLYQFVSTGEAFSRVLIVHPEYGGTSRVEWLLKGVNLTLFEFTGDATWARTDTGFERKIQRVDKLRLLYTSAEVRVGAGTNWTTRKTDFRGWDTGSNTRILDYPQP